MAKVTYYKMLHSGFSLPGVSSDSRFDSIRTSMELLMLLFEYDMYPNVTNGCNHNLISWFLVMDQDVEVTKYLISKGVDYSSTVDGVVLAQFVKNYHVTDSAHQNMIDIYELFLQLNMDCYHEIISSFDIMLYQMVIHANLNRSNITNFVKILVKYDFDFNCVNHENKNILMMLASQKQLWKGIANIVNMFDMIMRRTNLFTRDVYEKNFLFLLIEGDCVDHELDIISIIYIMFKSYRFNIAMFDEFGRDIVLHMLFTQNSNILMYSYILTLIKPTSPLYISQVKRAINDLSNVTLAKQLTTLFNEKYSML